ncbi:MAG: hypothetical protein ABI977_20595 [Acidobacteriota bacterium]
MAEKFELLLARLGEDPEEAGKEYNRLRTRLVNVLRMKGHSSPEDGADEALDRIADKLVGGEIIRDMNSYSRRVADLIALEDQRRQRQIRKTLDHYSFFRALNETFDERISRLMQGCVDQLPAKDRTLMLDYCTCGEQRDSMDCRQAIAERMQMTLNALRLTVFRLRAKLETCYETHRRSLD